MGAVQDSTMMAVQNGAIYYRAQVYVGVWFAGTGRD